MNPSHIRHGYTQARWLASCGRGISADVPRAATVTGCRSISAMCWAVRAEALLAMDSFTVLVKRHSDP
jgi:hypothetical protein